MISVLKRMLPSRSIVKLCPRNYIIEASCALHPVLSPTASPPLCPLCFILPLSILPQSTQRSTTPQRRPLHKSNRQMKRCTTTVDALLRLWHGMLGLPRQSPSSWYRDRVQEELRERRIATTPWQKLSETSDVFFSISRAQYDGFPVRKLPPFFATSHVLVYVYMLAKFTLRWNFFRTAAIICNAPHCNLVREVVNPNKDQKLEEVALRHQIDPMEFKRVGCLL